MFLTAAGGFHFREPQKRRSNWGSFSMLSQFETRDLCDHFSQKCRLIARLFQGCPSGWSGFGRVAVPRQTRLCRTWRGQWTAVFSLYAGTRTQSTHTMQTDGWRVAKRTPRCHMTVSSLRWYCVHTQEIWFALSSYISLLHFSARRFSLSACVQILLLQTILRRMFSTLTQIYYIKLHSWIYAAEDICAGALLYQEWIGRKRQHINHDRTKPLIQKENKELEEECEN